MKKFLVVVAFLAFLRWRHLRLDAHDKAQRFGPYADLAPRADG